MFSPEGVYLKTFKIDTTEKVNMNPQQIEQILSVAIDREIEAYEFYQDVSERANDATVRDIFRQLAKEERGHRGMLEQYLYDPTMILKISAPAADYKVAEATELPKLSVAMKPADAIALAMKKEQQAVEFYRVLGDSASDASVRDVFASLANMELGHKQRLENVFVEIGYPEVF
jgi:rubrerythrin